MEKIKIIDADAARKFIAAPESISLHEAESITEEAAAILAESDRKWPYDKCDLNGLTAISDSIAACLSKINAKEIFLGGLTEIGADVVSTLAKGSFALHLNGIKRLSPEAAYYLGTNGKYTSLKGLEIIPDEIAESFGKGIQDSKRDEKDLLILKTYRDITLTEHAATCLSDVWGFVLLNEKNNEAVLKAIKNFAKNESKIAPRETVEIRNVLELSSDPDEIHAAFEAFEALGPNEADLLKLMLTKNYLRHLMRFNQSGLRLDFGDYSPERAQIWVSLAQFLGKHNKTRELFKYEAINYFTNGDFAEDLAKAMTEELVPIVGYGTRLNGIKWTGDITTLSHFRLLSNLACPIRFHNCYNLSSEMASTLSNHRYRKYFDFFEAQVLDPKVIDRIPCIEDVWIEINGISDISPKLAASIASHSATFYIGNSSEDRTDIPLLVSDESAKILSRGSKSSIFLPDNLNISKLGAAALLHSDQIFPRDNLEEIAKLP
ncbi:MAG: hypothetical protein ORN51_08920 [Akkermansiaceae bacterium]|nr:hypothetical protein [Akkermansiaceae bacterium]